MVVERIARAGPLLAAGLILSACVTTTYMPYVEAEDVAPAPGRSVTFYLGDAFYAYPPDCVAVLASPLTGDAALAALVERALGRHLAEKVPRVVDMVERRRAERKLIVDLGHAEDRRYFARATGCDTFVRWQVVKAASEFAVVWSRRQVGLEVEMFRDPGGAVLWKAAHVASRSEGGLPLSFLAVPLNAIEASQFHNDADVLPSMVDDVIRRMFVTLPDLR